MGDRQRAKNRLTVNTQSDVDKPIKISAVFKKSKMHKKADGSGTGSKTIIAVFKMY